MARKKSKPDFETWYSDLFKERWKELRHSMEKPGTHFELNRGLLIPYFLDRASLYPVEALKLSKAEHILDMCAAPGGKSLAIATQMPESALLTSNDRSANRRGRLKKVLDEHLPEGIRARVTVTGHDASRWGLHEQNCYDRILADVPCSSERHLVQDPVYLKDWSPARTRHLSVQAYAILAAAFTALKPGGRIVYSTCALSPMENDEVIRKLKKKHGTSAVFFSDSTCNSPDTENSGEATEFGRIILPDTCGGLGPIFYACIGKLDGSPA